MKQPHNQLSKKRLTALVLSSFAIFLLLTPAAAIGQTQNVHHILLIGQDGPSEETRSRADCILLCSFHPEQGTITMTSFLRDLYVNIPGYGYNRINAAYAFGGMPLLRQTLQENFGIVTDGCVETDFSRFPLLVDLLGGVTVALRQDEADDINSQGLGDLLQTGIQHLNGPQALAYARIRKLDADGDFSRTARQQALIKAMLHRFQNAPLPKLLQLFKTISSMVATDFFPGQLAGLITELAPILRQSKIRSQQIPVNGSYTYETINGMSVLVPDMAKNRQFLESTLGN